MKKKIKIGDKFKIMRPLEDIIEVEVLEVFDNELGRKFVRVAKIPTGDKLCLSQTGPYSFESYLNDAIKEINRPNLSRKYEEFEITI